MLKLYDFELSGNCFKVRLLLNILDVPYEKVPVSFYPAREHKSEAFLAINPLGQLPVIDDDGFVLRDAQAILGYIARRYDSRLRQLAWHWFRAVAGFELRDLTSGFRLYNRHAITALAADEATLLDYQDVGVLLLLRKAGLRIAEVPVSMNLRQVGKSRIFYSWLSVASYMVTTTIMCLARWQVKPKKLTAL